MLQNGNEIKWVYIMFQSHSVINRSIVQSFKGRIKTTCRSKVPTATGTNMAPSNANQYMGKLE